MVDLERTRDLFMIAAILGVFGFAWSGWAQEAPPPRWRLPLGVLSGGSLLIGIAGGVLAWKHWSDPSSLNEADSGTRFGIVVGVELVLCAGGSAALAATRRPRLIAPWVSLVVGLHFLPLITSFSNWTLLAPAVAMVVSAALGWRSASPHRTAPSALTGSVNSLALVLTATTNLALGLTA